MIELRFGEWLSDAMAEQRVTQTQLGEAVGVGQSAVSDWAELLALGLQTVER